MVAIQQGHDSNSFVAYTKREAVEDNTFFQHKSEIEIETVTFGQLTDRSMLGYYRGA